MRVFVDPDPYGVCGSEDVCCYAGFKDLFLFGLTLVLLGLFFSKTLSVAFHLFERKPYGRAAGPWPFLKLEKLSLLGEGQKYRLKARPRWLIKAVAPGKSP